MACNGEAIIPIPTYGEYEAAVRRYGGKPVFVKATEELGIDIEGIEHHLSPETVDVLADLAAFFEKNPEIVQRFLKSRRGKRES